MDTDEVVLRHLRAARAEMIEDIQRKGRAVHQLDGLINSYEHGAVAPPSMPAPNPDAAPPMREAILSFMQQNGGPKEQHRAGDVAEALSSRYQWKPASIRVQLAKMAEEGSIHKLFRGLYSLEPIPVFDATGEHGSPDVYSDGTVKPGDLVAEIEPGEDGSPRLGVGTLESIG